MWLFIAGTIAILCVLIWYGSRFQNTYMLQIRLENAQRIDTYMRAMFHEIHTRAAEVQARDTITNPDDRHEIKAILDASDMAMRLRSFYVMPEETP